MPQDYQIQMFDAKAVSLESHDEDDFEIHALTMDDQRVSLVLTRTQLEALSRRIADELSL